MGNVAWIRDPCSWTYFKCSIQNVALYKSNTQVDPALVLISVKFHQTVLSVFSWLLLKYTSSYKGLFGYFYFQRMRKLQMPPKPILHSMGNASSTSHPRSQNSTLRSRRGAPRLQCLRMVDYHFRAENFHFYVFLHYNLSR